MCRLLCVKCLVIARAVLGMLLDREVRGRLITALRGEGKMPYTALCGLQSWVSSAEREARRKGLW